MFYHRLHPFSDEEVDAILGKCKFFSGEADPFLTEGGKEALSAYPMDIEYFPETGHGINHEQAELINKKIVTFK